MSTGLSSLTSRSSRPKRSVDNTFKYELLDLTAKNVQIYLYGDKNSPYEVALIFEYPKAEHNAVNPKIGLCLESFAVGDKAKRAFAGGETEDIEGTGEESASARRVLTYLLEVEDRVVRSRPALPSRAAGAAQDVST